jgi:hypothetical protein
MRDVMYLGSQCYQRQTFLIEIELLSKLQSAAQRSGQTFTEILNEAVRLHVELETLNG